MDPNQNPTQGDVNNPTQPAGDQMPQPGGMPTGTEQPTEQPGMDMPSTPSQPPMGEPTPAAPQPMGEPTPEQPAPTGGDQTPAGGEQPTGGQPSTY